MNLRGMEEFLVDYPGIGKIDLQEINKIFFDFGEMERILVDPKVRKKLIF